MKTKAATWMVAFVFKEALPTSPRGEEAIQMVYFTLHASRYLQSTIYKVQACPLFLVFFVLYSFFLSSTHAVTAKVTRQNAMMRRKKC